MAELFFNEKVIASDSCKLMKGPYDSDPLFCKMVLTEDELIFLNDEISKKDELLFRIHIYQIKDFTLIKEIKQKKGIFISLFDALVEGFANFLEGLGITPASEKKTDKLRLSFVNEQGKKIDFILDMMKAGDSSFIKKYEKLAKKE
jgi:hypothetical protein